MKTYQFNVPLYCLGAALGELSSRGAYIRKSESLNPRPVTKETYAVEAELDPNEHDKFQEKLAELIQQGPTEGPFCSFCGKLKSEVSHLLRSAAPDINICDECVNKCVHIINES